MTQTAIVIQIANELLTGRRISKAVLRLNITKEGVRPYVRVAIDKHSKEN